MKVICFEMNEDISLQSRGILQSFVWRGQVHDFGRITFKLTKLPLFNALSSPVSKDIRLLLFFIKSCKKKKAWNGLVVKDLTEPKPIVESYAFKAFD